MCNKGQDDSNWVFQLFTSNNCFFSNKLDRQFYFMTMSKTKRRHMSCLYKAGYSFFRNHTNKFP